MPLPLLPPAPVGPPPGYVDTGITKSMTASCSVVLVCRGGQRILFTSDLPGGVALEWGFISSPSPSCAAAGGEGRFDRWVLNIENHDGTGYHVVATPVSVGDCDFRMSGVYPPSGSIPVSWSSGPYHLAVRNTEDDVSDGTGYYVQQTYPHFAQTHFQQEYIWYTDVDTTSSITVGSYTKSATLGASGGPGSGAVALPKFGWVYLADSGGVNVATTTFMGDGVPYETGLVELVAISGFTVNGDVVDFSDYTGLTSAWGNHTWAGTSAGSLIGYGDAHNAELTNYNSVGISAQVGPPAVITYDLQATPNPGTYVDGYITTPHVVLGATMQPYQPTIPEGVTTFTIPYRSWQGTKLNWDLQSSPGVRVWFQAAWAAAQDPPLVPEDGSETAPRDPAGTAPSLVIRAATALSDPANPQTYLPVTLRLNEIEVNRPDGTTPSSWVSNDGSLTVSEASDGSTFAVSSVVPGAKATRTLLTHWRTQADYANLKHLAGDDIWWWRTFGYLRVSITVPPGLGPHTLTLKVNYTNRFITLGPDDISVSLITDTTGSATYLIPVVSDPVNPTGNVVDVDLLLPSSPGGVNYLGRVDSMELSGFLVGSYVLTSLRLKLGVSPPELADQDRAYFKIGFGVPIQRYDYSWPVLSSCGSWALGDIPAQKYKALEIGPYGGSPRFCTLFTDTSTGKIFDQQKTLQTAWTELDKVEGISATYSPTPGQAANRDAFGNQLTGEIAQCLWEHVTMDRVTPGVDYKPACSPSVCRLIIVPGHEFRVVVRAVTGSTIEVLTTTGAGARADGQTVSLIDESSGATVGTGTADVYGYVELPIVPVNGSRQFHSLASGTAGASFALKPRDVPREMVIVSTPTGWTICVIDRGWAGHGRRMVSDGSLVSQVDYYDARGQQYQLASETSAGVIASGHNPTGFRDGAGVWRLWYGRGGNVYQKYDTGSGWSTEMLALSGHDYPSSAYDALTHRGYLATVSGSHCKVTVWQQASAGDLNLSTDAVTADLGPSDNTSPAVEVLGNGVVQVWWVQGGVVVTKSTVDGVNWS